MNLDHIKPTGMEQNIGWALCSCLKNISDRDGLENNSGGFHGSNNAVQSKALVDHNLSYRITWHLSALIGWKCFTVYVYAESKSVCGCMRQKEK